MADKKISALTAATTPLAGTEVLPIVQGGSTVKVSITNVTAGRAVSTGALSVGTADITLDNAYSLKGKLVAGSAVAMIKRNSSDEVAIDEDGYGAKIGFGGRYNFAGGGDFTVGVGNLVIGTAAKGIDFSANTAAAGMTSELLNWYEEGNYTPTVEATTGSITSYTATAYYTRIGRQVTVTSFVTITNAGTGAGSLTISLPYTASGSIAFAGTGRENALTGNALQANISAGGTVMNVVQYNNITVIATSAQVRSTVTYFV
jgi:hypothetical protein